MDILEYAPWKRALAREIENLQLTPTQKIKLLEARTDAEPRQIVKDLRCIETEIGPKKALQMTWDALDRTYHTPHSPSQLLVKKLTQCPTIKSSDVSALVSFSLNCRSASTLHQSNPRVLAQLEDPGTLDAMVNCLDGTLRREWFTHRTTLNDRAESPLFHDFVEWIEKRTSIARFERNARPLQTSLSGKEAAPV